MKRNSIRKMIVILITAVTLPVVSLYAQRVLLNAYGSYVFEGGYNADYGSSDFLHGTTNGGMQSGAGVEYILSDKYGVEAMYLRRSTHAFQQSKMDPQKQIDFKLAMNYLLSGINGYLQPDNSKLQVFGSIFLGIVIEDVDFPDNAINSSITKFAWAVRLGGKYWLSERIGVRLQTQWTSFFVMNGGFPRADVYGLNTANINYPIAYQFEIGSGLIVRLGKLESNGN